MAKGVFSDNEERKKKISEALKTGASFNCLVCGGEFWRKKSAIAKGQNKFCSKLCYQSYQKGKEKVQSAVYDRSGKNNPNWKGGIGGENAIIRRSVEYRIWRETVFVRDNWTCQKCGARSSAGCDVIIEAHHIKPFSTHKELRLDVTNGLTLCKPCHYKEPKGREIHAKIKANK